MAVRAFVLGHGFVHLVIKNAPGIGPVGAVAGIAFRVGHRVVQVLAFKRWLVCFVAALTEGRHLLF